MSLSLENLKYVDQNTKDLVIRFIKEMQAQKDGLPIIPSLVISICILFYHLKEYFTICGDYMKIDVDGRKVSSQHIDSSTWKSNTVYGNVAMNNKTHCIYTWTINTIKQNKYVITIGLDSSNKKFINDEMTHRMSTQVENSKYYCISSNGMKYSHYDTQGSRAGIKYGKMWYSFEPVIKMKLNTKECTSEFYVDDESQGIAFEDIKFDDETDYYFAMSTYVNDQSGLNSFEIIDFDEQLL